MAKKIKTHASTKSGAILGRYASDIRENTPVTSSLEEINKLKASAQQCTYLQIVVAESLVSQKINLQRDIRQAGNLAHVVQCQADEFWRKRLAKVLAKGIRRIWDLLHGEQGRTFGLEVSPEKA